MSKTLSCELAGLCSGCTWIHHPYGEQLRLKREKFFQTWQNLRLPKEALNSFTIQSVGESELRDRVDLVLERKPTLRLGMYASGSRSVQDMPRCPQMTPALQAWFEDFRNHLPPIGAGSLRLRVSPNGRRGVWLDFSNLDIKALLEESDWIESLSKDARIEMGQKRKGVVRKENQWGLGPPVFDSWIPTYLDAKPFPLFGNVGGFTQVGQKANQTLISEFRKALPQDIKGLWLELGAGSGNFTFPLAHAGANVVAIELDNLAEEGLTRSLENFEKKDAIQIKKLNFQFPPAEWKEDLEQAVGIVADPPRSGLGKFVPLLSALEPAARPKHLVYVSCFAESFIQDAKQLMALGYRVSYLKGVDQFPQTPHLETIARFES